MRLKLRWELIKYRWNGCKNMNLWTTAIFIVGMGMAIVSAYRGLAPTAMLCCLLAFIALSVNFIITRKFDKAHKAEITKIIAGV